MIALLEAKAAGLWSRPNVRPNVIASLIVGIVALPLAMGARAYRRAKPQSKRALGRTELINGTVQLQANNATVSPFGFGSKNGHTKALDATAPTYRSRAPRCCGVVITPLG